MTDRTIRPAFRVWPEYDRRLREVVAGLTAEQLAIKPAPDRWPLWASIGHVACQRVFGLCDVAGEPGAETTPFTDPTGEGWEDDLEHPRSSAELVGALTSTFAIIEGALDRWTPEMLSETFERFFREQRQLHDRASVLQRMLTHEAYHAGEISQTLGQHGLEEIYIWRSYETS